MQRLSRLSTPLATALILAGLALPASAALSGYHDSAAQIRVILESEALADALRQQPIESIEARDPGPDGKAIWEVESRDCDIKVTLVGLAPEGVGATRWSVESLGPCDD